MNFNTTRMYYNAGVLSCYAGLDKVFLPCVESMELYDESDSILLHFSLQK